MENGHRNSGFSHGTWWFSIAMLVYQRVLWWFQWYYELIQLDPCPKGESWIKPARLRTRVRVALHGLMWILDQPPQLASRFDKWVCRVGGDSIRMAQWLVHHCHQKVRNMSPKMVYIYMIMWRFPAIISSFPTFLSPLEIPLPVYTSTSIIFATCVCVETWGGVPLMRWT